MCDMTLVDVAGYQFRAWLVAKRALPFPQVLIALLNIVCNKTQLCVQREPQAGCRSDATRGTHNIVSVDERKHAPRG